MTASRHSRRTRLGAATTATTALALLAAILHPLAAAAEDDLDQTIDPDQAQGSGRIVLDAGHVDFGPMLVDGAWRLQVHDDTTAERQWRNPDDVVLGVGDAAILSIPESETYAFLGMSPGAEVHVVPQVERSGVVWVGWNTQAPALLDVLSLGATLRVHAMEGPGDVVVYLQGGNFGAPTPLWSSHEAFPQDAWIEINTHTHANWVFSTPGVYLIDAEFTGELISGETLSARGTLRFAVGDGTDPAAAFAAQLQTAATPTESDPAESEVAAPEEGLPWGAWAAIGVGAVLLLAAVTAVSVASLRSRRAGGGGRPGRAAEQRGVES